jgi:mono/diheme cytochrome c family protein
MRRLLILAPLALAACMPPDPHEPVSGRNAFLDNCSACHGLHGTGNGPAAEGLDPRPADLTTIAARNGGVFPRDLVMSNIDGFHRNARFNPAMPQFGELDLGETVMVENADGTGTPVPEVLLALADYLESIQQ